MGTGSITQYFDVAQIALYVFWVFFAGLIYYLHQESKREGYPLESEHRPGRVTVQGWPPIPSPKTFLLQDGSTVTVPNAKKSAQVLAGAAIGGWPGAPVQPSGNAMLEGVGPGSYADRADVAELTFEGAVKLVPLRVAADYGISANDPDPRGMPVLGADGQVGGTVTDVWVDRSEMLFRYLEVSVPVAGGKRSVLLPINFTRVGSRQVQVQSILGRQFAHVPVTRHPDQVTRLEEEKIVAYYGGGTLYAEPSRAEPLL